MNISLGAIIERTAARFEDAGLVFGHGWDSAWDEAVALALHVTALPDDQSALETVIGADMRSRIEQLADRRIAERIPLAYVLGRCSFMGLEFLIEPGIVIPLKPFFGSMGVAPAPELGRVSSNPPGRHAGNLDNRELVAGSTLLIPVFVPGALFQVGDGHAAQGDGEVDQTGIETSLRGRLQLTVRKGMTLAWPRAETATDYIAMATDPDLTVATKLAIQEMINFLVETRGLTKHQAYQLTSIAGHVSITQLVDLPNLGVHVKMSKQIFQK